MGLFDLFKKNEPKKEETEISTRQDGDLVENASMMLEAVTVDMTTVDAVQIPFDEFASLGAGVASMLPMFRKVTQTMKVDGKEWFRIANAQPGDYLQTTQDGKTYAVLKSSTNKSRLAELERAGDMTASSTAILPINPAMLMMAASLATIEKKLDTIVDMEKQILSFLEADKEASIEGDLKMLTTTLKEYKLNWDNELYVQSHCQQALDIKRTAEGNLKFYQKQVAEILKKTGGISTGQLVKNTQTALKKQFMYYRLSLYIYSFASFLGVMLQGNYAPDYLNQVRDEIEERLSEYRDVYARCYSRIEQLTQDSVEHHVLKGVGTLVEATGDAARKIPFIKGSSVNEWLDDSGKSLKQSGKDVGKDTLAQFAAVRDSGSTVFLTYLAQVDRFYNQTEQILMDRNAVYLVRKTA